MTSPLSSVLTYDQAIPHRPTIAELGGGAFQDSATHPPDQTAHPSAGMFNQATKQLVALARMMPSLKIQVEFIAGVPTLTQFVASSTLITAADIQVSHNSVGVTDVFVTQSKIPTQLTRASGLTIVEDIEIDRMRIVVISGLGWRVKTKLGGTGVDAAFVFQVN